MTDIELLKLTVIVPEGWQLVPVEPTQKMFNAFWAEFGRENWTITRLYANMLNAAPQPEQYVELSEEEKLNPCKTIELYASDCAVNSGRHPTHLSDVQYTNPTNKQKKWVGLTPNERGSILNPLCHRKGLWEIARDIENKLKEKNT